MTSFGRPFSTASPVLAMPPQPAHQTNLAMSPFAPPSDRHAAVESSATSFVAANANGVRQTAGRKRSRDEAAPNLVIETPQPMAPASVPDTEDGWEYGEGMVLIRRNRGYVADAASQSGTWVEEKVAQDQVHRAAAAASTLIQSQDRPVHRSNKSQRIHHMSTSPPGTGASVTAAVEPPPSDNPTQPVVDHFTLHLGIGWHKISDNEHTQAAARGWSRYIENHYALSRVNILLESRGLQAYLVEAAEGFYLFGEDLRQGRLVSTHAEIALQNLKSSPPRFESQDTLTASESPCPADEAGCRQGPRIDMEVDMF